MITCTQCGTVSEPGKKFCGNCGAALPADSGSTPPPVGFNLGASASGPASGATGPNGAPSGPPSYRQGGYVGPPPSGGPYGGAPYGGDPYSGNPPAKKPNNWVWIAVAVGVFLCACPGIGIFAAILFPVFSQARVAARSTADLSNAKRVATAVLMYSADWDDKMPQVGDKEQLVLSLGAYLKDKKLESKAQDYEWNPGLAGFNIIDANVWLFNDPAASANGKYDVCFTDGHCQAVPFESLLEIKSRPYIPPSSLK